jgi:hypothetical protein
VLDSPNTVPGLTYHQGHLRNKALTRTISCCAVSSFTSWWRSTLALACSQDTYESPPDTMKHHTEDKESDWVTTGVLTRSADGARKRTSHRRGCIALLSCTRKPLPGQASPNCCARGKRAGGRSAGVITVRKTIRRTKLNMAV